MTRWQDIRDSPSEFVTLRTIWLALALSLLIHGLALLLEPPKMRMQPGELATPDAENQQLAVRLATPRVEAPAVAPSPAPSPPPARPRPRSPAPKAPLVAARPPAVPPLTAPRTPLPLPVPVMPVPAPPAPESPATTGDLAAYVAARRQARGDIDLPAPPVDDDKARRDRALAANIATINAAPQGSINSNSGGVFQITRLGYDDAEFLFFGWHKDARRRLTQKYEVRRDRDPDIRTAVVRRMIAIIREYEQEEFLWRSQKLGEVRLSARLADNAELERFFMRDFFGGP